MRINPKSTSNVISSGVNQRKSQLTKHKNVSFEKFVLLVIEISIATNQRSGQFQ